MRGGGECANHGLSRQKSCHETGEGSSRVCDSLRNLSGAPEGRTALFYTFKYNSLIKQCRTGRRKPCPPTKDEYHFSTQLFIFYGVRDFRFAPIPDFVRGGSIPGISAFLVLFVLIPFGFLAPTAFLWVDTSGISRQRFVYSH